MFSVLYFRLWRSGIELLKFYLARHITQLGLTFGPLVASLVRQLQLVFNLCYAVMPCACIQNLKNNLCNPTEQNTLSDDFSHLSTVREGEKQFSLSYIKQSKIVNKQTKSLICTSNCIVFNMHFVKDRVKKHLINIVRLYLHPLVLNQSKLQFPIVKLNKHIIVLQVFSLISWLNTELCLLRSSHYDNVTFLLQLKWLEDKLFFLVTLSCNSCFTFSGIFPSVLHKYQQYVIIVNSSNFPSL
jgi:hypothetical protein